MRCEKRVCLSFKRVLSPDALSEMQQKQLLERAIAEERESQQRT